MILIFTTGKWIMGVFEYCICLRNLAEMQDSYL